MAILQTYPECADPYRQREHVGLDFAYGAGRVRDDNTINDTAAGTITLADDTTSYIQVNPATGAVTANTTGFSTERIPLYIAITVSGAVDSVTDKRAFLGAGGVGGGGDTTAIENQIKWGAL